MVTWLDVAIENFGADSALVKALLEFSPDQASKEYVDYWQIYIESCSEDIGKEEF